MDAVKSLQKLHAAIDIALVVWATIIIGYALPLGHKYEKGWIFGLAWFPIILFATIEIVSMTKLPKRFFPAFLGFIAPFVFVALNVFHGTNISIENFVVQTAMLQFTASMLAFALQAAVLPFIFKTAQQTKNFFQEEAFPQLFGAAMGLGVSWFAFDFLITYNVITTSDLPLIIIGILQGAITTSLVLYKSRYE